MLSTLLVCIIFAFLSCVTVAKNLHQQSQVECEETFIGGGWSGVYAAYRRANHVRDPRKLCLFERSNRIGGRTYSTSVTPDEALGDVFVLDVGAYRFSPDMHLPGDLIMKDLELATECYEPGCLATSIDFPPSLFSFNYSAPLRRIVDPTTRRACGYITPINKMIERMISIGVRVFRKMELIDIEVTQEEVSTKLVLRRSPGGAIKTISSRIVFLNLPRNRLLKLPGFYQAELRTLNMIKCVKHDMPKSLPRLSTKPHSASTKAYLYYSDAWWITKINQTVGTYPSRRLPPIKTSFGIYVNPRWNDGPTVCNSDRSKCHGFLLVYYSVSNETFFVDVPSRGVLGEFHRKESTAAAKKLDEVHEALLEGITPVITVNKSNLVTPDMLVVGRWNKPNAQFPYGYEDTAPIKVYYSLEVSGSLGEACGVRGLTEKEYRDSVLEPFGFKKKIFLVNNDWGIVESRYQFGSWAEEGLLQAERALALLETPRPKWLNRSYYENFVMGHIQKRKQMPTRRNSGRSYVRFTMPTK